MTSTNSVPIFDVRPATLADATEIEALIPLSIHALQADSYSQAQREAAIGPVFGLDTRLILDRTYLIARCGDALAGCGGWSRRRTVFGGDVSARDDALLDPATDAARIRAFFVHPEFARRGVGSLLMRCCEAEARAEGFTHLELTATLAGEPLYARHGFVATRRYEVELPNGEKLPLVLMRKIATAPLS